MSATKAALHVAIDEMSDQDADDLLDYLNLLAEADDLTDDEAGELDAGLQEIARGEYTTLDELRRDLGQSA